MYGNLFIIICSQHCWSAFCKTMFTYCQCLYYMQWQAVTVAQKKGGRRKSSLWQLEIVSSLLLSSSSVLLWCSAHSTLFKKCPLIQFGVRYFVVAKHYITNFTLYRYSLIVPMVVRGLTITIHLISYITIKVIDFLNSKTTPMM